MCWLKNNNKYMKTSYTLKEYEEVEDFFLENKGKTISGEKIKALFGFTTVKLQSIIHDLRTEMWPIVSCGKNGYKFSEDKDEITKTYMSLTQRAKSILVAANGLKEYLENC